MSHSLSTAAVATGICMASLLTDGPMHQTVVEVGRVSLFQRCASVGFPRPLPFADVHSVRFSAHMNVDMRRFSPSIHLRECGNCSHAPFEFRSSVGDHLEVCCIFGCNVEESSFSARFLQSDLFFIPGCSLLSFCFFDCPRHSSGQTASVRVVCWTVVGRPFTRMHPSGSLISRSTCARKRHRSRLPQHINKKQSNGKNVSILELLDVNIGG